MIINATNLRALQVGFKAVFQGAFAGVKPTYQRIAMTVPSASHSNVYGWLGQFPRIREWIGDRVVQNLLQHDFTIKNKPFEFTVGVDRDAISDDTFGIYNPMFAEMGRSTAIFPDELTWDFLPQGFATFGYDGQFFFDTDHPVLDAAGQPQSVSNYGGGAGAAWYLIDDTRAIKPIIFQDRKKFEFVARDRPEDDNVFNRKEYQYGVDARCNVGFGLWQLAYASKQDLTDVNYEAARAAMISMAGDHGRKLGLMPKLLIVGATNEGAGRRLVTAPTLANGATNPWFGTAELLVVPYLP